MAAGEDLGINSEEWRLYKSNPKTFWKYLVQKIRDENRTSWLDKKNLSVAQNLMSSQRFKPFQNTIEFFKFLHFLKIREPKVVLEIGRYAGGALLAFTTVCHKKCRIISIDPFFGPLPIDHKTSLFRKAKKKR